MGNTESRASSTIGGRAPHARGASNGGRICRPRRRKKASAPREAVEVGKYGADGPCGGGSLTEKIVSYIGPRQPCDDCGAESDVDVFTRFTAHGAAGRDVLAGEKEKAFVGHLCAAHARVALGLPEKTPVQP